MYLHYFSIYILGWRVGGLVGVVGQVGNNSQVPRELKTHGEPGPSGQLVREVQAQTPRSESTPAQTQS